MFGRKSRDGCFSQEQGYIVLLELREYRNDTWTSKGYHELSVSLHDVTHFLRPDPVITANLSLTDSDIKRL
jgi:hypothetical protein